MVMRVLLRDAKADRAVVDKAWLLGWCPYGIEVCTSRKDQFICARCERALGQDRAVRPAICICAHLSALGAGVALNPEQRDLKVGSGASQGRIEDMCGQKAVGHMVLQLNIGVRLPVKIVNEFYLTVHKPRECRKLQRKSLIRKKYRPVFAISCCFCFDD